MEDSRSWVSPLVLALVMILFSGQKILAVEENAEMDPINGPTRCNVELNTFLPLPYSNSTNMICKPVWNSYVLQYSQSEDHVVTIIVSTEYTSGWVGMGFSRNGMMLNSSAMVGWINKEGEAKMRQYYVKGFQPSEILPNKGELPLTTVPPMVALQGPNIYLAFQLKFGSPLSNQPILLAFGSRYPTKHHHLSIHDDKTTLVFDFSAGSVSAAPDDLSHMKKTHGVLGLVGWGLILPSGVIVARYFKHKDPLWYYLHILIQFVGFLVGIGAVIVGAQLYSRINANFTTHRGIGYFILVLTILQVLAFFIRPNKESKMRRYWNWYHHWMGRIALFFGAMNIVVGIQIGNAGNEWKIGYGFLLSSVLITSIVLEALMIIRRSKHPSDSPPYPINTL